MQNKLKSSIYIESTGNSEQSAHALSANITTRQGFDLHIAAVSQKKPGQYAEIDTPRKTLLSFATSLQSGGDRSIERLIHRAVSLVTISTGGYIKRRGGAPCGLVAAILHEDQLYTIQIGTGEVLQCHNEQFTLLTGRKASDLNQIHLGWLGESSEFSLEGINFQKNKLVANSTILVCQPAFLQTVKNNKGAFRDTVTSLAKDSEDFANDLAHWALQNGVETGLTMAVHHLKVDGRVKFEEAERLPELPQTPVMPEKVIEPAATPSTHLTPVTALGGGYGGVELNLNDKLVSKVLFDEQLKNEADQANQENSLDKKSLPFVEIAKEFVEEIVEGVAVSDTIRTTALDISPPAPIRTNGIVKDHHPAKVERVEALTASMPATAGIQYRTLEQGQLNAKRGRFYKVMTIGSVGLFLTMVALGIAVVLQRGTFTPAEARGIEISSNEVAVAESEAALAVSPQQIGVWSQGTSSESMPIFNNEALDARGLVHFSLGNAAENDAKSVYLWPGSKINFEHTNPGTAFALEAESTLFIDSTQGTIRPELTDLFGVAESSAGCMSVNYRSTSAPLVISCYAGTCRWLGPLNRTYEIPAGERLELDSNLRLEEPAKFEPIYYTETAVFARTLGGVPTGQEISNQCLEPYLAEGEQLTAEQTSAAVGAMSLNVAKNIGWWRVGNSPYLNELGKGATVTIRGLTHFTLVAHVDEKPSEHEVYAWPGSELHFDPELDENQFDVGEGSSLFLNSTDSVIRPFFPDLFGTAESSDGCMAITFPSATKPLALSCYSGTCAWNGALNRNYNIPIGQRLELASNPRVENPAVLEPIRRTETAVVARTLGSIPAGLEMSNRCVEPYLINPERLIVVPLATSTPLPTAEPTEPLPTLPPLETPETSVEIPVETPEEINDGVDGEAGGNEEGEGTEGEGAEEEVVGTPEPEVEATSDNLIGS